VGTAFPGGLFCCVEDKGCRRKAEEFTSSVAAVLQRQSQDLYALKVEFRLALDSVDPFL